MKFTKRATAGGGDNLFLKFKDGDKKTIVLRGEVFEFRTKWQNGKSVVVPDSDHEGRSRFRVNAVIFEENKYVAKIWEYGISINNQLVDIQDAIPQIDRIKLRVSRSGSTKDNTQYNVIPLAHEPLSAKQLQEIESVNLNLLSHSSKEPKVPDFGAPPPEDDMDRIPF